MTPNTPAVPLFAVGMISASALAYEILLTRVFAMVHWHQLVATVVSLALLGYGASGSFLTIFGERLQRRFVPVFIVNALLFSLSAVLCVQLAQKLQFDPQALTDDPAQLVRLAATFLLLAVPLFAAANCIGLTLAKFRTLIPRVYGTDLIGAALGAILLTTAFAFLHPIDVLLAITFGGVLAALSVAWRLHWHPWTTSLTSTALLGALWLTVNPSIEPAPYKDLARSLNVIGAELVHEQSGISGTSSVVRNTRVPTRYAPGLSLHSTVTPPAQPTVFVDGDLRGTLLDARDSDANAQLLGDMLSALPYHLLARPEVALLNAGTGFGVHQALALGAGHVTAIEPNPQLTELTCKHFRTLSETICDPTKVHWRNQTTRGFMASEQRAFDLIGLDIAVDIAGLDALNIDFDLSRQAIAGYLKHLADNGILVFQGDTRLPPRLSMRLLQSTRDVLSDQVGGEPAEQIILLRGWQRFLLLTKQAAFTPTQIAQTRVFADRYGFDLVWLPGITSDEANRFQQLNVAHYHLTAKRILNGEPVGPYDYSSTSDDRPFPYRFSSWSQIREAMIGSQANDARQIDIALLAAALTLLLAGAFSVILILLPLIVVRSKTTALPEAPIRLRVLTYFGLTGIAFLFIELGLIQHLQLFLDQPLYATVIVLASFLFFAGIGSLWAQRLDETHERVALRVAVWTIALMGIVYVLLLPALLNHLADNHMVLRIATVLVLIAPLALAMGVPFSLGLRRFGSISPNAIGWAWGINGCASVISAAGAPLYALTWGFSGLVLTAVAAYLLLPLALPLDQKAVNATNA